MFKVDDTVRILNGFARGRVGNIIKLPISAHGSYTVKLSDTPVYYGFFSDEMELVNPEPKRGDIVRGYIEGEVTFDDEGAGIRLGNGDIRVYLDELTDVKVIKPAVQLPTEPGSVVTFRHVSSFDHPDNYFQAILITGNWLNIKLGGDVTVDRMVLVSVDRVGV